METRQQEQSKLAHKVNTLEHLMAAEISAYHAGGALFGSTIMAQIVIAARDTFKGITDLEPAHFWLYREFCATLETTQGSFDRWLLGCAPARRVDNLEATSAAVERLGKQATSWGQTTERRQDTEREEEKHDKM